VNPKMTAEELNRLQDDMPWAGAGISDVDIWHDNNNQFEKMIEELEAERDKQEGIEG